MKNNLELIKPLLEFSNEDDFYLLQIILRKKDFEEPTDLVSNNSRSVKSYYITSEEHLERSMGEITKICTALNARAMIWLNKRSFKKSTLKTLQLLSEIISGEQFKATRKCFDSACGKSPKDTRSKWIVDIDGEWSHEALTEIKEYINLLKPFGSKIIAEIPSKSGLHLITSPFDTSEFSKKYPSVDIQKDNPVNLIC